MGANAVPDTTADGQLDFLFSSSTLQAVLTFLIFCFLSCVFTAEPTRLSSWRATPPGPSVCLWPTWWKVSPRTCTKCTLCPHWSRWGEPLISQFNLLIISTNILSLLQMFWHYLLCDTFISQGMHGVKDEVFLSVPCVLGNSGLTDVIHLTLKPDEEKQLVKSAETLWGVQKELTLWKALLWILSWNHTQHLVVDCLLLCFLLSKQANENLLNI